MAKLLSKSVFCLALVAAVATAGPATPTAAAKAAFDRGEKALEAGNFDQAVTAYGDALKATPGYAAALNGLGSALFKLSKRDEALAQFRAATEADPAFKLAWFNLGFASRKMQQFAEAAKAYERYTALDPADPDGFYGLGESYRQSNQPEKAIAAYETYVKKEARPTEQKYVDRAKDYISQLRSASAKPPEAAPAATPASAPTTAPTTTITLTPTATPAGQPVPAADPLPSLAARKMKEGDQFMAEKKYREASFSYQDAVNADPSSVEALFKLGNAFAILGYFSQAIDKWTQVANLTSDPAIKKSAQDNVTRAQQKLAQAGGGSPQEAGRPPGTGPIADSTRAQARQAYEQGVQLIGQRRFGDALASLNQCLQLEPALAVGYIARGSTLIGLRRFAEAAIDYQYALKLEPNLSAPLYGLAEAYKGMNRVDDARQYYQRYVVSAAPDVRADLQSDARSKLDQLR
ncbi:MAG: tetratricopeptide repeat protein [Myxococcaceae bacterium]|nr:tetratricopeptide repeat protein [Myxococcaceae bacterium]MCA3014961.1 tetratricopeptide repeat protein [Myxococcaceae bacterium]